MLLVSKQSAVSGARDVRYLVNKMPRAVIILTFNDHAVAFGRSPRLAGPYYLACPLTRGNITSVTIFSHNIASY
jgi:hypothetical protein